MDETYVKRSQSQTVYLVLLLLLVQPSAHAATFCVSTAADLQSGLETAETNAADDVIQVVRGTYQGNFIYASTEAFSLTIEGGYGSGCGSRLVDSANTVLDGMLTGNTLVLSSTALSAYTVDGVTLQNGSTRDQGAGLFALTSGGNVTLTNSTISNNTAERHGGGSLSAAQAPSP